MSCIYTSIIKLLETISSIDNMQSSAKYNLSTTVAILEKCILDTKLYAIRGEYSTDTDTDTNTDTE